LQRASDLTRDIQDRAETVRVLHHLGERRTGDDNIVSSGVFSSENAQPWKRNLHDLKHNFTPIESSVQKKTLVVGCPARNVRLLCCREAARIAGVTFAPRHAAW